VSADFIPYYEGFKGRVEKLADQKYLVRGVYSKTSATTVCISELPVGTWTKPYEKVLEKLMDSGDIKDFTSLSTESTVNITVQFSSAVALDKMEMQSYPAIAGNKAVVINGIEKALELTTTVSATNIHMFNYEGKLHKYANAGEIVEEFSRIRLSTYEKRRLAQIDTLRAELVRLTNHALYIMKVLDGSIDLRRKTAAQVDEMLSSHSLMKLDGNYNYLTKLPMDSVSQENVDLILKKKANKERELEVMMGLTAHLMWQMELDELEREYIKYRVRRETVQDKKAEVQQVKKPVIRKKTSTA
jgi:DNA topoisomerase-2